MVNNFTYVLAIVLMLAFSSIAKADEVPPEYVTGGILYSAADYHNQSCSRSNRFTTEQEALDNCISVYDSWLQSNITQFCNFTSTWIPYSYQNYDYKRDWVRGSSCSLSGSAFIDIFQHTDQSYYQCPSTHPIHIDNNQDGQIDAGDLCQTETQCKAPGTIGYVGPFWDSQTPSYSIGSNICTAPPNPSQPGTCSETITSINQIDWSCEQGQCLYTMQVESTGQLCESGEGVNDISNEVEHDPYQPPNDGDYDNQPDTDTDVVDTNQDGDTSEESLSVIKNVLSEIENNTDDLEGLSKDSNALQDGQLLELKNIDGTLKKILASDGVKNSGGNGSGVVQVEIQQDPPPCIGEACRKNFYAPNDWDEKNFGTVITAFKDRMLQTNIGSGISGFMNVQASASCPIWSADIPMIGVVTFDQLCSSVGTAMLSIIRIILLFGFTWLAFQWAFIRS